MGLTHASLNKCHIVVCAWSGSSGYADISKSEFKRKSQALWGGSEEEHRWTDHCEYLKLVPGNAHLAKRFIFSKSLINKIIAKSLQMSYLSVYMFMLGGFSSLPAHWQRSEESESSCGDKEPANPPAREKDCWPGESGKFISVIWLQSLSRAADIHCTCFFGANWLSGEGKIKLFVLFCLLSRPKRMCFLKRKSKFCSSRTKIWKLALKWNSLCQGKSYPSINAVISLHS